MRKIFLFLLIPLLLAACRKIPKDEGIIVSEIDLGICISPPIVPKGEYVISDSAAYQQLKPTAGSCSTNILPYIDFNQYTLLGKYASGGCKAKFYRQVLRDDQSKKYDFTIYVRKKICFTKVETLDMNWVLVPKLPQGYSVTFHLDEK